MSTLKPYLEAFSADELMKFIDHYVETNQILHVPGQSWESCDQLAWFLGFGYDRTWSQNEINILTDHYPQLGAVETSKLLPLRTPLDCITKAKRLKLHTFAKLPRKKEEPSPWMIWEYQLLEKYYPVIGSKTFILLPERTEFACATRATMAGFGSKKRIKWTEKEKQILEKYFPMIGMDVEQLLPGRTQKSISTQAENMGLHAPMKWTPEEDTLLRLHYPQMGADVSKFFMGRRSPRACAARARILGLTSQNDRRAWTVAELSILDEHYPSMGTEVSTLLPGRSKRSCQKMAMRRNLSALPRKICKPASVPRWTAEELAILQNNYPEMGGEVCKLLPNRTKTACVSKASSLGLLIRSTEWTEAEDDILKTNYSKMGIDVVELLPRRSKAACYNRATELNLRAGSHQWTEEEETILKDFYPTEGVDAFQRLSNRTEEACKTRLRKLGIYKPRASDDTLPDTPKQPE